MITDNKNIQTQLDAGAVVKDPLFEDFKTSVVLVSLLANLAVMVSWLTSVVK